MLYLLATALVLGILSAMVMGVVVGNGSSR